MRQLAVPQRRGWDDGSQAWEPQIWRGRQLFFEAGCVDCHVPRHVTGDAAGSVLGQIADTLDDLGGPAASLPSLSNQVIWPFTDLLLHDMGGSCEPRDARRGRWRSLRRRDSRVLFVGAALRRAGRQPPGL